jgi:hypothetical protein
MTFTYSIKRFKTHLNFKNYVSYILYIQKTNNTICYSDLINLLTKN